MAPLEPLTYSAPAGREMLTTVLAATPSPVLETVNSYSELRLMY
jgi:hypothetical protein